jgi:hypothetical protein
LSNGNVHFSPRLKKEANIKVESQSCADLIFRNKKKSHSDILVEINEPIFSLQIQEHFSDHIR